MRKIIFLCTILFTGIAFAQNESVNNEEQVPECDSLIWPKYHGGYEAMQDFIISNVKYPEISLELNEEGKVFVQFQVGVTGAITDVKVVRGVSDELDAESMRVIKLMPNWIPALCDGERIPAIFTVPINFKIDNSRPTKEERKEAKRLKKIMRKKNKASK